MTTATAPMTLCQRKATSVDARRPRHGHHAGNQPDERAVARGARKGDGQDEHAEDRAIEERPEPVHDLDQRAQLGRPDGNRARKQAPQPRGNLRHGQVVGIRRLGLEAAPVEVNHGRGRQRVQLAGDRVGRGHQDGHDQQADEADGKLREDERRDDVVDVGERPVARRLPNEPRRPVTYGLHRRLTLSQGLLRRGDLLGVAAVAHHRQRGPGGAAHRERLVELRLEGGVGRRRFALPEPLLLHAAEQERRRREHVEHEDEDAEQQHDHLQRNLPIGAHQQRAFRFVLRPRREVSLDLALVGAEVGTEEEQRRDGPRPERVLIGQVEREVEAAQAARGGRDAEAVGHADPRGKAEDRGRDHGEQPEDDEHHDLHVGPRHRLDAAEHRVDHGRHRDRQRRRGQIPAEDERQHDGRRRHDGAARHPARDEEQQAGKAARLAVEAALEVLVRRVDAGPVEERHQRHRQDDHRQRAGRSRTG